MKLILFLLFILPAALIHAQELQFKTRPLSMDGIPKSSFCTDLLEDQYGFLWMATTTGLVRHNGSSTTTFNVKNGLQEHEIYRLYDDSDSLVWIQYFLNKKIDIMHPVTKEIQTFEAYFDVSLPFNSNEITYTIRSANRTIYIKTTKGEYYKYLGQKKWQKIAQQSPDISLPVQYVHQNKEGQIWIQEKDTCYRVAPNGVKKSYFVGDSLFVFGEHQQDLLLYEHQTNGIQFYRIETASDSLKKLTTAVAIEEIKNINIILNHDYRLTHLWNAPHQLLSFPRIKEMLLFRTANLPSFLPYQEQLNSNITNNNHNSYRLKYSHHQDRWIAFDHQIFILHITENRFQTFPKIAEDQLHSTRSIVMDDKKNLYVQSYDLNYSLWKKAPNQSNITALPFVLHSPGLSSILSKDGQTLYMGTEDAHLVTYNINSQKSSTYYNCAGVLPSFVLWAFWSLHEDEQGQIWIGSRDGLYLLDTTQQCVVPFEQYNQYTSLSTSTIGEFYENKKGLWIASSSGLYLIDKNKGVIAHYHSKAAAPFRIPSDDISFIYEEDEQNFWLGTQGDGLIHLHLETGVCQQWTTLQNLSNDHIHAIYPDAYNNLWMSSNYGLMRMNLADKTTFTFLPEDGLPHEEFNRQSHYQDQEGYLYFGGLKGVVKFHPKDFSQYFDQEKEVSFRITDCYKWDNKYNKEINLTDLVAKNHPIDYYAEDIFLTIEYALLDFRDPKNHQYSYKIDGYNKDWILTNDHSIRLNSLPTGNYTLHIRARTKFGDWQKNSLKIHIRVHTFFYKTAWFLALCILLGIGVLVLYYRLRIRKFQKQKQALEAAVENRTLQIKEDKEVIEKQAQELKRLDELKNSFFVNISHELRTPLTLIATPLQYLLEQSIIKKNNNKQLTETLRVAYQNSKKLQILVDEILLLSKLDAHKLEVENTSIRLLPFLQQIYSSFQPKALVQDNNYQFLFEEDIDLAIWTDWKKLERILYNLLSNAFKFAPAQSITLSAKLVENNQLLLEVTDTGSGIHPTDLPLIFDRYYQSKHSTSSEQGGTGIGLALSYEFARLLGGSLQVTSVLHQGSSFQLQLPIVISKDNAAQELFYLQTNLLSTEPTTSSLPLSFNKPSTILVVEDNEQLRDFIQQLLGNYFQVLTAVDGQQAWDMIEQNKLSIDLIISDLMMPRMDGYQLSKKLKTSKKWAAIPLIILSARTTTKDKLTALRIGVDDYLVKPFDAQELIARVQNMLRNYHTKKEALLEQTEELVEEERDLEIEWLLKVEAIATEKIVQEAGNFTVTTFAAELELSDRQLRRKLQLLVGISPSQYLRELKLMLAKKYLEEQEFTSVSKVASSVGFNTTSHFIKLYIDRFGKSPLDYFL